MREKYIFFFFIRIQNLKKTFVILLLDWWSLPTVIRLSPFDTGTKVVKEVGFIMRFGEKRYISECVSITP